MTMFNVPCTICGDLTPGSPDADVTCPYCERNFAGDPLRHPPRQQRRETPLPWWQRERLPLAPNHADGQRALTFVQGPWVWSPEHGIEERRGE